MGAIDGENFIQGIMSAKSLKGLTKRPIMKNTLRFKFILLYVF